MTLLWRLRKVKWGERTVINKRGPSLQYWTSTLFPRSVLTAGGHWLSTTRPQLSWGHMPILGSSDQHWHFHMTLKKGFDLTADTVHGHAVRRVRKCHCQRNKVCIYEGYTRPTICNCVKNWWISGLLPVTTLVAAHCWIVLRQPRTTELRCDCRGTLESTTKAHVTLTLPS